MSDVFVSYDADDKERVRPLVELLEEQGWSVWWDRRIPPGRTFADVIHEAIAEARCVVVVWTAASVVSRWVRREAAEGERRGILVPVLLDQVKIPFAFHDIQAAGLNGYPESAPRTEIRGFIAAVRAHVGPVESAEQPRPAEVVAEPDEPNRGDGSPPEALLPSASASPMTSAVAPRSVSRSEVRLDAKSERLVAATRNQLRLAALLLLSAVALAVTAVYVVSEGSPTGSLAFVAISSLTGWGFVVASRKAKATMRRAEFDLLVPWPELESVVLGAPAVVTSPFGRVGLCLAAGGAAVVACVWRVLPDPLPDELGWAVAPVALGVLAGLPFLVGALSLWFPFRLRGGVLERWIVDALVSQVGRSDVQSRAEFLVESFKRYLRRNGVFLGFKAVTRDPETAAFGIAQRVPGWLRDRYPDVAEALDSAAAALREMQREAENGDLSAMVNLGLAHEMGHGVRIDHTAARSWYQKAAEGGDTDAMIHLANLLKRETGELRPNPPAAFAWYRKSAEAGNPVGMAGMGVAYRDGEGVEQDHEASLVWFRKSAEAGNAFGMACLGFALLNGRGVEKDETAAKVWLRKAAEAGDEDAAQALAK